jgi:hypothetical protein
MKFLQLSFGSVKKVKIVVPYNMWILSTLHSLEGSDSAVVLWCAVAAFYPFPA